MAKLLHVELFKPSEAADLTGISLPLQRDYRRRFPEWLPKASAHARFNLFECLQMRFVADAAEFGIGPSVSIKSGGWVAHMALYIALRLPGCIDGDLAAECTMPEPAEGEIRDYTARRVFAEAFGLPRIAPSDYAFLWGDGSDYFAPSLDHCLRGLDESDPRSGKPMLALSIHDFAKRVVSSLPRPAVRILDGGAR